MMIFQMYAIDTVRCVSKIRIYSGHLCKPKWIVFADTVASVSAGELVPSCEQAMEDLVPLCVPC